MHELVGRVISPLQDGNDSIGANALALDPETVIYSTSLASVNDSYGCISDLWRDIAYSDGEAMTAETSSHSETFSRSISRLPAVEMRKKEARQKKVSSSFHQVKDRRNTSSLKNVKLRKERAPQRLFMNDVHRRYSNESIGHSETARMRLTTNVARKVEMMETHSMIRKAVFKSCSDAAKHMGINRTKLSRSEWFCIRNLVYDRIRKRRAFLTNVPFLHPSLPSFFSMPIRRRHHNELLLSLPRMWQSRF